MKRSMQFPRFRVEIDPFSQVMYEFHNFAREPMSHFVMHYTQLNQL